MRVGSIPALLAVSLAAMAGLHMASAGVDKSPPSRRPNIVFFLCDDLGTGDLACLGSQDIKTPNIDALFARGTRLSRHWAGSAVCAPSRCVLLTGMHPGHAVIRSNREAKPEGQAPEGQAPMPAGTVTLAGLLRDVGYVTAAFGKWGLGGPGSTSEPRSMASTCRAPRGTRPRPVTVAKMNGKSSAMLCEKMYVIIFLTLA